VWRFRPFPLAFFWFVCFFFGAKNEQVKNVPYFGAQARASHRENHLKEM
jgi:hypothetical protein